MVIGSLRFLVAVTEWTYGRRSTKYNCSFKIGDGSRIKLWEDVWCGENTLMAIFPSIYAMAGTKGARVEELWEPAGVEGSWNLRLERHFYDLELKEIQRFISTVNKNSISPGSADSLLWKGAHMVLIP